SFRFGSFSTRNLVNLLVSSSSTIRPDTPSGGPAAAGDTAPGRASSGRASDAARSRLGMKTPPDVRVYPAAAAEENAARRQPAPPSPAATAAPLPAHAGGRQ